jgi:hypothetical protein
MNHFLELKKGTHNPTMLSLVPEKNMSHMDPIIKGLFDVEKLGMDLATKAMMETVDSPQHAAAALMYAASILTVFHEEGVKPATVDLFADLPIRDYSVIMVGNELNRMDPKERAAIFARQAMKIIVKGNCDQQNPESN